MKTIRILHLEDNPSDAGFVAGELKKANILFDQIIVNTREQFMCNLERPAPDIVLSDHSLPAFNSLEAIRIIKNKGLKIPFILVTGNTSEAFAVRVIKAGADDYILKDRLRRLPSAILNAIEKFKPDTQLKVKKEKEKSYRIAVIELKQLTKRLKLAVDGSGIGIWDWDIVTDKLIWDKQMYKLYGMRPFCSILNYNNWVSTYLHPDDKNLFDEDMRLALRGEKQLDTEFRVVWHDGSIHYMKSKGIAELDKNKNPIRMLGTNWDITDGKKLEAENDVMTKTVINRNKSLEQFSFIISHNLHSQIAGILSITKLLTGIENKLNEDEKKFLLKSLCTCAEKLDAVVIDIDDTLQVNHNGLEKKVEIRFSELTQDIKSVLFEQIKNTRTEIKEDFNEADRVYTVKGYLYSIFLNLIANSIKYRQKDVVPVIEINARKLSGKIVLIFKDNGTGIDLLSNRDDIFGLYKRFNTEVEGKGMGLYMVKKQVEALDGKISIQSEVNKGTIFEIEIPG